MQQTQKQHIKYKVKAYIRRLVLNKPLNFQTKITWKRNVNKTETEVITHQQCESVFNQMLELELSFVFNAAEAQIEPKMTEFAITVIYKGKVKSGGYVKFDAAEIINKNYEDEVVKLSIMQCPDPNAYIQVVFGYQLIDESSRSLFNELSMLNPIGFQQDLSQIDFQEEDERRGELEEELGQSGNRASENRKGGQNRRASQTQNRSKEQAQDMKQSENKENSPFKEKQYHKIHNILDKFQTMSRRFKSSQQSFFDDQNSTKNESLQVSYIPNDQQERLKTKICQLQRQLHNREELITQYQSQLDKNRRLITELQIKVQLLEQKSFIPQTEKSSQLLALAENQSKYRLLYEKTLADLEEIKQNTIYDANFSKQSQKFHKFVEELNQIDQIPQFNQRENSNSQKLDLLERQNLQLQTKIASISHNIAQLFNAAYDFGGAKLLDYLQSSIGLIQSST